MTRSPYVVEYEDTFTFLIPIDRLWAAIGTFDWFGSWWTWLREFSVEGEGLRRGTVLRGVVAPPLPYRMRLEVVLDECEPEHFIRASVHGDLEGTAELVLVGDANVTDVRASWTIEMMQRPMRLAARVGHPLLRWGHDRVVDATVDGFRRGVSTWSGGAY